MPTPPQPAPRRVRKPGPELFVTIWQAPLWAVPFTLFFMLLAGAHGGRTLLRFFEISTIFALVIRLMLWVAEFLVMPRAARAYREPRPPLPIHMAIYASASIVGSYLAAAIVHFTVMKGFLGSRLAIVQSGMFALLFTVLMGGIIYAMTFYRLSVERARAVEQARADLAQAELRALRAQIHPHFLFNALNTIAALVREDPAAAEDVTTRLAELFRYTLRASEREHSTFADELAFLRDYLAIERRRFGTRLTVREAIAPGLERLVLPTLLLQPLVENAVRHGIATRTEGGTVTLGARRDGERLVIEVADDGPGLASDAAPSGNGFGLHSVRERLRVAGPTHALEVETAPGRGTRIRVIVPAREATEAALAPPPRAAAGARTDTEREPC